MERGKCVDVVYACVYMYVRAGACVYDIMLTCVNSVCACMCVYVYRSCSSLICTVSSREVGPSPARDLLDPFLSILSPGGSSFRCLPNLHPKQQQQQNKSGEGVVLVEGAESEQL